jgi:hypothetical protein
MPHFMHESGTLVGAGLPAETAAEMAIVYFEDYIHVFHTKSRRMRAAA